MNRLLSGRSKIYTDESVITRDNIIPVLKKAYATHRLIAQDIQFLMDYERGRQDLQREKKVRPEIDIQVSDNAANYVKEFKLGYFWGNPVMLVQRGNKELHDTDSDQDDTGITALNEMIRNGENIAMKDLKLGEFVEIAGIGHRLVDIKTKFEGEDKDESFVNIYTLDSRNTFCVYYSGIGERKVLGVTYTKIGGKLHFTAFSDDLRFDITGINGDELSVQINPLGRIPIVEYERSYDRTGCFERHISDMDGLNILVSDFANDSSQKTQEIWWGNDIRLPEDENGNVRAPKTAEWILTETGENGNNPKIQALASQFNSASTLSAISYRWNRILQKCKVPTQQENETGGSTGTAMDMSSGWAAAEVDAMREQQMVECSKREELALIIKALEFVPTDILPLDSAIRKVHVTDVDFHFNRKRNYDLSIKANTFATLVSHGINGRHALKVVDLFEDTEQVWIDSQEDIKKYQKSIFEKQQGTNDTSENKRMMSDTSDQSSTSPILDGMNTEQNKVRE